MSVNTDGVSDETKLVYKYHPKILTDVSVDDSVCIRKFSDSE
jgi:hypothetical protein